MTSKVGSQESPALSGTLLLVGAGKMGGALLKGWLAGGISGRDVSVLDPAPPAEICGMLEAEGINTIARPDAAAAAPQVIVMAVKPQVMDDVFPAVAALAGPATLVVSIAAGRSIAGFEKHLPAGSAVVRAMPNTPAAIARGITVCCGNAHVSGRQRDLCAGLLGAVGEVAWVADENLIDAVTAVSGSGPAYVFLLAECLADAGVAAGLDPALAMRLARATVSGAGELMHLSDEEAAVLRHNVTSPGGTTAAALAVLMAEGGAGGCNLKNLMNKAVAAASQRSRQLRS